MEQKKSLRQKRLKAQQLFSGCAPFHWAAKFLKLSGSICAGG